MTVLCMAILLGLSGCFDAGPADPICGLILYEESFGASGSGWPQSADNESKTLIQDGRYRIEVLDVSSYIYVRNEEQGPYADLCYSARVWDQSDGEAQAAGLMFRCTNAGQFYVFSIHPDSHSVSFAIFSGDRARPIRFTSSDAVRGVGKENHVQVVAEGNHFRFYVNDELVLEEFDDRLSTGGIGVSGASWETLPTVLTFDDLVVRRLE
jgi:hypothetical protein